MLPKHLAPPALAANPVPHILLTIGLYLFGLPELQHGPDLDQPRPKKRGRPRKEEQELVPEGKSRKAYGRNMISFPFNEHFPLQDVFTFL